MNVPCGIMDQFVSALASEGSTLLVDCRSHAYETVPLDDAGVVFVVANSGVKHRNSSGAYAERVKQCGDAVKAVSAVFCCAAALACALHSVFCRFHFSRKYRVWGFQAQGALFGRSCFWCVEGRRAFMMMLVGRVPLSHCCGLFLENGGCAIVARSHQKR